MNTAKLLKHRIDDHRMYLNMYLRGQNAYNYIDFSEQRFFEFDTVDLPGPVEMIVARYNLMPDCEKMKCAEDEYTCASCRDAYARGVYDAINFLAESTNCFRCPVLKGGDHKCTWYDRNVCKWKLINEFVTRNK